MAIAESLFAPSQIAALPAATDWVTGTLLGSVAISLCVIAVAFVGLLLLSGRIAVRDGLRVVLGCFVLLGAPAIAAGLYRSGDIAGGERSVVAPELEESAPDPPLPPANYDPYAGASLRPL